MLKKDPKMYDAPRNIERCFGELFFQRSFKDAFREIEECFKRALRVVQWRLTTHRYLKEVHRMFLGSFKGA